MHTALACVHKCFTPTGHLKSAKSECLWSSVESTAEAFTCCRKKYLCSRKNHQICTWYVLTQYENIWVIAALETAPSETQCDETISHMVTAGRSHIRNLRNACVTPGKTAMTSGTICHSCFEILSWPYCTSNFIINICFWLLETCTKYSYFIGENMRPCAQRLAFQVRVYRSLIQEYIVVRWSTVRQVSRQTALNLLTSLGWLSVAACKNIISDRFSTNTAISAHI